MLPSAVEELFPFDPACTFWVPVVVTLTSSRPLPAMYASVVLERRLKERAPAIATAPSALLALPAVRALGESSGVVASSSS